MSTDKTLAPARIIRDPFALLRQMTKELDRTFGEPFWTFGAPLLDTTTALTWAPKVDVFEKDDRLVTRVDLPGLKKEDVTVEVTDGCLTLSGERKVEKEEKKDNVYRAEREYGSFSRTLPLPEGVKLDDVKATFVDGVLEVSVPLPVKAAATVKKVAITEPVKETKAAA